MSRIVGSSVSRIVEDYETIGLLDYWTMRLQDYYERY